MPLLLHPGTREETTRPDGRLGRVATATAKPGAPVTGADTDL